MDETKNTKPNSIRTIQYLLIISSTLNERIFKKQVLARSQLCHSVGTVDMQIETQLWRDVPGNSELILSKTLLQIKMKPAHLKSL